jgi:hypothetical protein
MCRYGSEKDVTDRERERGRQTRESACNNEMYFLPLL